MTTVQTLSPARLKNILYLTDFSKCSEAALRFVRGIACTHASNVHVLHVLTPLIPESCTEAIKADEDLADVEMRKLDSQLAGIGHVTRTERGIEMWPAVARTIEQQHIDLVVLGTHGRTGAGKLLLGSIAEEIFRRSPVPVLTVGPAAQGAEDVRFRRILFATDFTRESMNAAPLAVSLANDSGARLLLLHVIGKHEQSKESGEEPLETQLAETSRKLEEIVPIGIDCWPPQLVVEYGHAADRIVESAKEHGADLIVLGVRNASGHLGAATHLEWATAHKVLIHAPCPVLTVRG